MPRVEDKGARAIAAADGSYFKAIPLRPSEGIIPPLTPLVTLLLVGMVSHAFFTLLVSATIDRRAWFFNWLDGYLIAVIYLTSVPAAPKQWINPKFLSLIIGLLAPVFAIALWRFGALYALLEFRPLFVVALCISGLGILRRRPSFGWVTPFVRQIYLPVFFAAIAVNLLQVRNKEGLFGELNYDMQLIVIYIALQERQSWLKAAGVAFLAKTKTFGVYVVAWVIARRLLGVVALAALGGLALYIYSDAVEDLDRIVLAAVWFGVMVDSPQIAALGQVLTDAQVSVPALSWYAETQQHSAELGFLVPSNFHGHFLRLSYLLGLPATLLLYGLLLARLRKLKGSAVLFSWIVYTAISQSVFHHVFLGSLFLLYCLAGDQK